MNLSELVSFRNESGMLFMAADMLAIWFVHISGNFEACTLISSGDNITKVSK